MVVNGVRAVLNINDERLRRSSREYGLTNARHTIHQNLKVLALVLYRRDTSSDATNGKDVIVGRQLQVIGVCSRSTANGDQRFYINNKVATFLQTSTGVTTTGAEIGRYCFSPGTVGGWGMFDLYDIAIYPGTLSNAEADSIAAAMVSACVRPRMSAF